MHAIMHYESTKGEVIKLYVSAPSSPDHRTGAYPVYRFTDRQGRKVEATSRYARTDSAPSVGEEHTILFEPQMEYPQRFVEDPRDERWVAWTGGKGLAELEHRRQKRVAIRASAAQEQCSSTRGCEEIEGWAWLVALASCGPLCDLVGR